MKFFRKRSTPEDPGSKLRSADGSRQRPVLNNTYRSQVFSYHAARSTEHSDERRLPLLKTLSRQNNPESNGNRRMRILVRAVKNRFVVILVIIICLAVFVSQIGVSRTPKITYAANNNGSVFLQSKDTYEKAATSMFAGSITNRNKLTVDTGSIASRLEQKFPELESVIVTIPMFGHQPTILLQPAEPTFILAVPSAGNYILDSHGRALATTSDPDRLFKLQLQTVQAANGLQPQLGRTVLPGGDISFMQTVLGQLNAQHIGVRQVILPPAASELDVYIDGNPYFVKFNLQDQAGALQQAGAFVATAKQLASHGITPKSYIDVRLDGKVYYK